MNYYSHSTKIVNNTVYCPKHIEVIVEVIDIAIDIRMSIAMEMITVPEMQEWQEYLECGLA